MQPQLVKTNPNGRITGSANFPVAWTSASVTIWEVARVARHVAMCINALFLMRSVKLVAAYIKHQVIGMHPLTSIWDVGSEQRTNRHSAAIEFGCIDQSMDQQCASVPDSVSTSVRAAVHEGERSHNFSLPLPDRVNTSSHYVAQFTFSSAKLYFLDIFARASMPVSKALREIDGARVGPVDLIHCKDLLDYSTCENILLLAHSGLHTTAASTVVPHYILMAHHLFAPRNTWMVCRPALSKSNWLSKSVRLSMTARASCCQRWVAWLRWSFWRIRAHLRVWPGIDSLMFQWLATVAPFASQACACMFSEV